ncbi:MAG TPA: ATP-binding cassette domain-containing protein [Gammaproteobacteria bacterium]|nr:ATP-binding cassette domain-containing protein [Gammaproteobacteria bacterium]
MNRLNIENLQVLDLAAWSTGLQPGECVFLFGPSGSGKTRLLRAIADLDLHEGMIELDGESRRHMLAHEWRARVALLPAESCWWNEKVGEHFTNCDTDLLARLGFSEAVMDWEILRLSTGEKQRLALLRALSANPSVLLLDEPTANLDKIFTQVIEEIVGELRQQKNVSVIWVTHDDAQMKRIAKRGWHIRNCSLVETTV